jgi:threonine dehydratase
MQCELHQLLRSGRREWRRGFPGVDLLGFVQAFHCQCAVHTSVDAMDECTVFNAVGLDGSKIELKSISISRMSDHCVSFADVEAAHGRIRSLVHKTPVLTCTTMDELASAGSAEPRELFFKCELFQRSGSFKARGACNAVASLESGTNSVSTHSSGNHAQALALAAKLKGIPAHIVMPSNAPTLKRRAVEGYGASVYTCAPTQAAREEMAAQVTKDTSSRFVHPSEDPAVIAGQGTIALELIPQVQELVGGASSDGPVLDAIIVPIGGGGMTSGIAVAAKGLDPRIRIIAAEPLNADDAARSKASGSIQLNDKPPQTIADGLKTTLGPNTWPVVRDLVERVVTVSEEQILSAMRLVYERMKLAIEPSAAVGVAAALSDEVKGLSGLRRVGIVLCGGNVDLDSLPFVLKA